jgi:hypothetical protein
MKKYISRRNFFNKTMRASAGALVLPSLSGFDLQKEPGGITPLIITSHTNQTGQNAIEAGWEMLRNGATEGYLMNEV